MISVEGPSMLILFIVLSAIFLHQDNAHFRETNDQGDFKLLLEILSKPRLLDRRKEELVRSGTGEGGRKQGYCASLL